MGVGLFRFTPPRLSVRKKMNVAFFLAAHRRTKPSAEGNPKSENVAMRDLTPARVGVGFKITHSDPDYA